MKELMKNKQALILTSEDDSYIPIAVLIISDNIDLEDIERDIQKVKDDLPGEWQFSDIIEGISVKHDEISFECISL